MGTASNHTTNEISSNIKNYRICSNKMTFLQSCPAPEKKKPRMPTVQHLFWARLHGGAAHPRVSIFHEAGDGGNDGGVILWSQLPQLGGARGTTSRDFQPFSHEKKGNKGNGTWSSCFNKSQKDLRHNLGPTVLQNAKGTKDHQQIITNQQFDKPPKHHETIHTIHHQRPPRHPRASTAASRMRPS